jgi:hypothetical protein
MISNSAAENNDISPSLLIETDGFLDPEQTVAFKKDDRIRSLNDIVVDYCDS